MSMACKKCAPLWRPKAGSSAEGKRTRPAHGMEGRLGKTIRITGSATASCNGDAVELHFPDGPPAVLVLRPRRERASSTGFKRSTAPQGLIGGRQTCPIPQRL